MSSDYSPPVGTEAVIPKSNEEIYENRLLILKPGSLKEEYRHAEFQYFYALCKHVDILVGMAF